MSEFKELCVPESEFKELCVPEVEQGKSIHVGKWFVFVNDYYHKYINGQTNFLHINGQQMCELKPDIENGRIMFDTEIDAFSASIAFYELHNKAYPWTKEFAKLINAEGHSVGSNDKSQTMRFD